MWKGSVYFIFLSTVWITFAYKMQTVDKIGYYFYSDLLTFDEAEKVCNKNHLNPQLVYITDEQENILIAHKDNFEIDNITDFWIGGRRNGTNKWTWSGIWRDDRPMYTFWDIGEPKNDGDCIASTITYGKWSAQDCNQKKPFVCKYVNNIVPATLSPCPWGWLFFKPTSSCIGLTYTGQQEMIVRKWYYAEAHCNQFGAHLPSIHSMEEFEIIQTYIIFAQTPIWLGLKFDNGWKWSDGSAIDYLPWHKQDGYPVQTDNAKCGRAGLAFITNQDCNSAAAVLCKMPALY